MLGVLTIARDDEPFSDAERELFSYLAGQAALSLENVGLHETIQRQAVTDELTGLSNHRRFQEIMTDEVERVRALRQDLGLMMLDIDDFKRVNDNYGHQQGDVVLREVARVLRESSREIDEPARYGGEEMAVALPQTGLQGAYEFAERVRASDRGAAAAAARGRRHAPRHRVVRRRRAAGLGARRQGRARRRGRRRALPGEALRQEPHREGRVGLLEV